jgi:hypothetical protein
VKLVDDALDSHHIGERTAALATRTRKLGEARDAKLAKLAAEAVSVRAKHDKDLDAARAAVTKRGDELDRRLASDIRDRLHPAAARFATEPRAAAIEIAKLWRDWQAQAEGELGEPLHTVHILGAFCAAAGRLEIVGNVGAMTRFDGAPLNGFQPNAGHGAAVIEQSLRALEVVVDGGLAGLAPDAERTEVVLAYATSRRQGPALAAFDAKRAAALAEERSREVEGTRAAWRLQQEKLQNELIARRGAEDRTERIFHPSPATPNGPYRKPNGDFVLPLRGR